MTVIRSVGEQRARREIRVIARHLAHISKDADPVKLAEMHGTLGRAIAETATAKHKESPSA